MREIVTLAYTNSFLILEHLKKGGAKANVRDNIAFMTQAYFMKKARMLIMTNIFGLNYISFILYLSKVLKHKGRKTKIT